MFYLTIEQLRRLTRHITQILGDGFRWQPYIRFDHSDSNGTPYIKIDENGYHWIVNINNIPTELNNTTQTSKVLYWIASHISFTIAFEQVQKQNHSILPRLQKKFHPNYNQSQEILIKQISLMKRIDHNYESICQSDIKKFNQNF
ncbi:MAG: hypothetical protein LBT09_09030 [Planctomycetaceae bacterium]|jgi:hypothetical protein|nr:hypothetical protein [Planctomycetaceae bacterium]